jgi:hypothetical protein
VEIMMPIILFSFPGKGLIFQGCAAGKPATRTAIIQTPTHCHHGHTQTTHHLRRQ